MNWSKTLEEIQQKKVFNNKKQKYSTTNGKILNNQQRKGKKRRNNAITDGGVALPKFPLTIVMKFSNFKSLRISRNSKDLKKANIGSRRVRSRPSRLRRSGRY